MGGPGGIGGFLQGLLGGGGQAQAAPAPATGGAAPAAPAAGGQGGFDLSKIPMPQTSFLDHPLVQGALATYLGAISSPSHMGLGGAIGHGGLAGLQAYSSARQAQYQPYLIGAQLGQIQSTISKNTAQTAHFNAQTAQIAGEGQSNQNLAAALSARAQQLPPGPERDEMMQDAATIGSSTKWINPIDYKKAIGEEAVKKIEMQQKQWELQYKDPAELQHLQAGTEHEQAGTIAEGLRSQYTQGQIAMQPLEADVKRADIAGKRITQGKDVIAAANEAAKEFDATHPGMMGGKPWGTAETTARRQAFVTQRLREQGLLPQQQAGGGAGQMHQGMHGAAAQQGLRVGSDGMAYDASGGAYRWQPEGEEE